MKTSLVRVLKDQQGATAIEYGFLLALIAIVILGSATSVATKTITMWEKVVAAVLSAS